MKRRRKILLICLGVLALALAFPLGKHLQLKWRVERYKAELRAHGEKLSILEIAPPIPDSANGAPVFLNTAARLPQVVREALPTSMRYVSPGRARVTWADETLPTESTADLWPMLETRIGENQETLGQLAAIVAKQQLAFELDDTRNPMDPSTPGQRVRNAVQWFCTDALLSLHQHNPAAAQQELETCLAIVDRWQNDPQINSGMARSGISMMTLNATWEALQFPDWTEAQLAQLQHAWQTARLVPEPEAMLSLERVIRMQFIARWRSQFPRNASGINGNHSGFEEFLSFIKYMFSEPENGFRLWSHRYPRYWKWQWWDSYEQELELLKDWQAMIETARTARARDSFASMLLPTPARNPGTNDMTFSNLLTEKTRAQRFIRRAATIETGRSFAVAAIALKRYRLKHGALPADLAALVPEFLPQVPRDRMDDGPLRYRLNPDATFLLYSVGGNRLDDQGDSVPAEVSGRRGGRGAFDEERSIFGGKDWVWPMPAAADELKSYEDKLAAIRQSIPARPVAIHTNTAVTDLDRVLLYFAKELGFAPGEEKPE